MSNEVAIDTLVLGSGPGALCIAAALAQKELRVQILTASDPNEPWPYTYGIWGEEVDELGLNHLLEHRWSNTVSYFGKGDKNKNDKKNNPTKHNKDYGLFDKKKLQLYWLNECKKSSIVCQRGKAKKLEVNKHFSEVTTEDGDSIKTRLVIDATGYEPVFLKKNQSNPIAVQTCYGVVGEFNKPPVEKDQFVLMDYRCDHLSKKEIQEPPTFLYAMDLGNGRYFLEETSLGLSPPMSMDTLKGRLKKRLKHRNIEVTSLEHEELGFYLPMNLPLPDMNQPILGFGGSASMVHPASGYLVGGLLRRAPELAEVISKEMKDINASPAHIASIGWENLWTSELRRKQALYQFGLEKLMRFKEPQLRNFFTSFFKLPKEEWYGFLTNKLSLIELIKAMVRMFINAPWDVRWGLMGMQGREFALLVRFLQP